MSEALRFGGTIEALVDGRKELDAGRQIKIAAHRVRQMLRGAQTIPEIGESAYSRVAVLHRTEPVPLRTLDKMPGITSVELTLRWGEKLGLTREERELVRDYNQRWFKVPSRWPTLLIDADYREIGVYIDPKYVEVHGRGDIPSADTIEFASGNEDHEQRVLGGIAEAIATSYPQRRVLRRSNNYKV